jgi:alkylation response protein AidB-like acyl-CoA dehydrogenase
MDFDLSEDQAALRDAAAELLAGRASGERVRAVVDAGGGWDRDLWAEVVAQGWPALLAPEAAGGIGLGWVEAAVVLECVGARLAPLPVLGQLVAVDTLVAVGHDDRLGALVAGDAIAAVAGRTVAARPVGPGWELSGSTEPVAFAPSADVLLVVGADADGVRRLFLVEQPDRPAPEAAMDLTREMARVHLDGAGATELGGPEAVESYLDRGAVAYSAEMLGCADAALSMSVQYAGEREQFGRPIGSFQAVKHRCADMLVDVEGMRSATWWAAWALSTGDAQRSMAASTAKAWCSDAADRVVASALQVHGGIGFTWDSDVHLHLKRVQYDRLAFGDAAAHRDRLADMVRARVRAGEPVI